VTTKTLKDTFYKQIKNANPSRTLTNGDAVPSFITFRGDIISVYTNSTRDIGSYMVVWSACLNSKQAYYYQEILINDNTPPFLNMTTLSYVYELGKR